MKLRQIVAEGGEHHVVAGVRSNAGRCPVVGARPSVLEHVRILQAPLQSSFRSLIILVPETDGTFNNVFYVAIASAAGAGHSLARGKGCFGVASRVVEERRAITNAAITGCVEVGRAEGILPADIGVDVQFGTRMPFDSARGLATAG